jgi:hypothetical protein
VKIIVTKNSLVAYSVIPGTTVIQLTNFIVCIFVMQKFSDGANDSRIGITQEEFVRNMIIIMTCHGILMIQLFCTDFLKIKAIQSFTIILGMTLVLTQLILVCNMLSTFPLDMWDDYLFQKVDAEAYALFFWCKFEITCISGLIASNILFLAIRSCVRHKVSQSQNMTE